MTEQRMDVAELKNHLGTLEDPEDVRALLEGEDRKTAKDAINARIGELTRAEPIEDEAVVYTTDDLIRSASAFGTTEAGVAGALHEAGLTGKDITKEDAQKAVDAFLERPIPTTSEEV